MAEGAMMASKSMSPSRREKTRRFRLSVREERAILQQIPPQMTFSGFVRARLLENQLDRFERLAELRARAELANELRALARSLPERMSLPEAVECLLVLRRIEAAVKELK
jgi:uncharacterized protein YecE (DUF72 family)